MMYKVTVTNPETLLEVFSIEAETLAEFPELLKNVAEDMRSGAMLSPRAGEEVTPAWVVKAAAKIARCNEDDVCLTGDRGEVVAELHEVAEVLKRVPELQRRREGLVYRAVTSGALTRNEAARVAGLTYQRIMQIIRDHSKR